ncbi:carbohydrate binding domain containing protein [Entamoeba histolytica HM-1:IMSS-B]|uniref:CBM-cenC domain-containing protein n=5 Tax=Entamoeba histolytica TaxID=5759 RepID=C4LSI7_ENTH1|nr:hypothetical protein EHI_151450 [Entamoeba histolytica HM-1:IMSS]EAL51981.1 hypothetical protein EHI_151450 [Entamoeba histolytica HM-1:IMSS]EMH76551.1 carbohydrate binding domain containing protein [Entamoeba histolytica HM-1:IMSS-B]ENY60517.1 carbohydrate binding domain containing protein [Entamoeba histolytica HM-1:IMSS-A]GAT91392.1 hypothetical protein CL6EHI_151450 [Entamoeba histolytica]|eukprot:XP_657365.1 hypothetical protein EHI_151450 [Entamoeba histolytica HM-1:IMSS]
MLVIGFYLLVCTIAKDYIVNGGFEEGSSTSITGWSIYGGSNSCVLDSTTYNLGSKSLHCTDLSSKDFVSVFQYRSDLVHGIKYKLTAYIKVKNVQNGALMVFAESADYWDGVYLYSNSISQCKTGTCTDKWYKLTGNSVMTFGKQRFIISARLQGAAATGEFWIDDISLEPIEQNVLISVDCITWRQEAYIEPFEIRVGLDVNDTAFQDGSYLSITGQVIRESDNQVVKNIESSEFKMGMTFNQIITSTTFNPSSLTPGYYIVKITCINSLFNNKVETVSTTFRKLSANPSYDIYVDKNHVTWVNGKKFFPLGCYMNWYDDFDIEHFKDSPFNLWKGPGQMSATQIQDVYDRTNGKIRIINPFSGSICCGCSDTEIQNKVSWTKQQVELIKNEPGLFGYYIADEPSTSCVSSMKATTRTIRENDPNHVVWPAINDRFNLNLYKEGFDTVGMDDYPVQTFDQLESIWVMMTQGRKKMVNSRAMWNIVQIFDWTVYNDSYNLDWSKEFPPTEEQLRNMIYQNIACGAMGIIYFDYSEMRVMDYKNPFEQEWEKVKKVTYELRDKYADIIMCVEEPPNDKYILPLNDGLDFKNYVATRQWRCNGYDYILIVNVRAVNNYIYSFTKASNNTCLEVMMGSSSIWTEKGNIVKLNMSSMDVVWIKGYESDHECPNISYESSTIPLILISTLLLVILLI